MWRLYDSRQLRKHYYYFVVVSFCRTHCFVPSMWTNFQERCCHLWRRPNAITHSDSDSYIRFDETNSAFILDGFERIAMKFVSHYYSFRWNGTQQTITNFRDRLTQLSQDLCLGLVETVTVTKKKKRQTKNKNKWTHSIHFNAPICVIVFYIKYIICIYLRMPVESVHSICLTLTARTKVDLNKNYNKAYAGAITYTQARTLWPSVCVCVT